MQYLLPLLAGFTYTLGALFGKQAIKAGGGAMRIAFLANIIAVILFAPLLLIDSTIINENIWWAPMASGFANFLGIAFTFAAIRVGDVSIQTPLMGIKILIVAILATLFLKTPLPGPWWIAAFLATVAVALLGKSKAAHTTTKTILTTIALVFLSAISFASDEVIVAKYASQFGEIPFIVLTILSTAIASISLIPFFRKGLLNIPRISLPWVLASATMMALEELFLFWAIAFYKSPTAANILYSSRGIWSIVLIWAAGHWFKNTEKDLGPTILTQRLAGTLFLFTAIIIVILTPKFE